MYDILSILRLLAYAVVFACCVSVGWLLFRVPDNKRARYIGVFLLSCAAYKLWMVVMVIVKMSANSVPAWVSSVLTIPLFGMVIGALNLVAFFRWNNKQ